jgi:replicative superfamily II helicase
MIGEMLSVIGLAAHGAPAALVDVWARHVRDLTDVQERAVRAGALDGASNLLVVAPTSSGKTFVGEMAATASAFARRRHAIFIVPFKAVAEEHFLLFRERYGDLLSVVISTGDWSEYDADIRAGSFNLAVMTYEKLMGFLVHQPDLLANCTTVVVDEVQSIGAADRGAKLEMLLTQVLVSSDPPQVIALSASLDELNELDQWFRALLVMSTERPIPLTQSVCDPTGQATVIGSNGERSVRQMVQPQVDREGLLLALCERLVVEGSQVLVFRAAIKDTVETARQLRERLRAHGLPYHIAERINELDDSDAIVDLRLDLASGVAFHNGDLTHPERQLVEAAFRAGDARVLVSTTTLAMGVNLPSDIVIVADSRRFVPVRGGWGQEPTSVADYRNAAGRAGRLGQRTAGLAVLLADTVVEHHQLVNAYLLGQVEPVRSQIARRPFAEVVFSVLSAGLADDEPGVAEFITATLAYRTFYEQTGGGLPAIQQGVARAVTQCLETGLIVREDGHLRPTQIGKVFAGAGVPLATATRLAGLLESAGQVRLSQQDLLFEVAWGDETGDRPWPRRQGGHELDPRRDLAPDGTGCSPDSRLAATLAKPMLTSVEARALLKTRCLMEWISGASLRGISRQFSGHGAAPPRVQALGKNAAWLLDALVSAAEVRGLRAEVTAEIRRLADEVRYGLPSVLAPLARLHVPGIPRGALLRLYRNDHGVELYDPEVILDTAAEAFDGLLTPLQVARIKQAILDEVEESLRRWRAGQVARTEQTALPVRLIENLYTATGGGLEQAVTDALNHVGLSAARLVRQPTGEEDIQLTHATGTVVISVTASQDDVRPIKWSKVREVLGTGAGLNPVNYVCVARPAFESLAERKAGEIARETGPRRLLLVPIPMLAEALVRCGEGRMHAEDLGDLLAMARGVLRHEDLHPSAQPIPRG